jgi:molybdopterin-guanine dinucleotide biosynthesis protein A
VTAAGVLLAGGLARRMGGGDKCLTLLAGRPLLDYVVERLKPQVCALSINANGDPARFGAWGLPVIADTLGQNPGPLAGVLAGMRWALTHGYSDIVTVPADTPFIPDDLCVRLEQARRDAGAEIAIAASGGRRHPVVALWPAALADTIEHAVRDQDIRGVTEFLKSRPVAVAEFSVLPRDPFFNINDPGQLAQAERLLRA